jgi:hypothetical protein
MLIVEFSNNLSDTNKILYRDIDSNIWRTMELDLQLLNLLISNYGYNAYYIGQALDSYQYEIECNYYNAPIKIIPKGIKMIKNMPGKY